MISPDKRTIEFEHRYLIVMRVLGITEKERLILSSFFVDDQPWPIQKLADRVRYSRASVREALHRLRDMHFAHEIPSKGWVLTSSGYEAWARTFTEAVEIANRKQKRFSKDYLSFISNFDMRTPGSPETDLHEFNL